MAHAGWGTARQRKVNLCGHPEKRHYAKGLCRECYRATPEFAAKRHAYYLANKEQFHRHHLASRARRVHQTRLYGITKEQWDEMCKRQDGRCAICYELPGKKGLAVDHCHKRGQFRALLCAKCNMALGAFRDNSDIIRRAADYVDRHVALYAAKTSARPTPEIRLIPVWRGGLS